MSNLSKLSLALEEATDEYALLCDAAAEAEAEAERVELSEFARLRADREPVESAKLLARKAALNERRAANVAAAREKAGRQFVRSLEMRMTAAMSHQRFVREQT